MKNTVAAPRIEASPTESSAAADDFRVYTDPFPPVLFEEAHGAAVHQRLPRPGLASSGAQSRLLWALIGHALTSMGRISPLGKMFPSIKTLPRPPTLTMLPPSKWDKKTL